MNIYVRLSKTMWRGFFPLSKIKIVPKAIFTVVLDRINQDVEYGVYSDDLQGGELAAEAILKGDPKKVVVIAGPESVTRARDRLLSVEYTLKKAQVPYALSEIHILWVGCDLDSETSFFRTSHCR